MRRVAILVFAAAIAFGYSDVDMDGVEDQFDTCPNTPFELLVDEQGCPLNGTKERIRYKITTGGSYLGSNALSSDKKGVYESYLSGAAQIGDFEFSFLLSNQRDTYIAAAKSFYPTSNLSLKAGISAILPTYKSGYNNEKTDYGFDISAEYDILDSFLIFASGGYTDIRDSNTKHSSYKDKKRWAFGGGYYGKKSSYIIDYSEDESMYKGVGNLKNINFDYSYALGRDVFLSAFYSKGLSKSSGEYSFGARISFLF